MEAPRQKSRTERRGAGRTGLRLKLLKAIRRVPKRHPLRHHNAWGIHRYNLWRTAGMMFSLGSLAVVPLSGLARVDLWGGEHSLLFERTTFKHGLAGVIVGIAAMYVVTFLSNVIAGRMFCGWGCPVGQISRFGEEVDTPGFKGRKRRIASFKGASFSFLFVLSMLAWWTDLRVLWLGSAQALGIAWGIVLTAVAWSYAHGRWWRWNFCKSACPIGLYYSFVSPASWYGISFRNQLETCVECDACDNVCPVDLAPRELMEPIPSRGGISIDDAPGRNHCLECGDCVRACEWMIDSRGEEPVPLTLGFYRGPQRLDRSDEKSFEISKKEGDSSGSVSQGKTMRKGMDHAAFGARHETNRP